AQQVTTMSRSRASTSMYEGRATGARIWFHGFVGSSGMVVARWLAPYGCWPFPQFSRPAFSHYQHWRPRVPVVLPKGAVRTGPRTLSATAGSTLLATATRLRAAAVASHSRSTWMAAEP